MELQRLRMEGEYKMFIDSLLERNKSKNFIKGFHPSLELSLFKGNYSLFKRICCLTLLLLMNASIPYSNYTFQGKLFLSKDDPSSFIIIK